MEETRDGPVGPKQSEHGPSSSTSRASNFVDELASVSLASQGNTSNQKEGIRDTGGDDLPSQTTSEMFWSAGILSEPNTDGFYSIIPDKRLKDMYHRLPALEELSRLEAKGCTADVIVVDTQKDKKLVVLKELITGSVSDFYKQTKMELSPVGGAGDISLLGSPYDRISTDPQKNHGEGNSQRAISLSFSPHKSGANLGARPLEYVTNEMNKILECHMNGDQSLLPYAQWNIEFSEFTVGTRVGIVLNKMEETPDGHDGHKQSEHGPSSYTSWATNVVDKFASVSLASQGNTLNQKEGIRYTWDDDLPSQTTSEIFWSTRILSEPNIDGFYTIPEDIDLCGTTVIAVRCKHSFLLSVDSRVSNEWKYNEDKSVDLKVRDNGSKARILTKSIMIIRVGIRRYSNPIMKKLASFFKDKDDAILFDIASFIYEEFRHLQKSDPHFLDSVVGFMICQHGQDDKPEVRTMMWWGRKVGYSKPKKFACLGSGYSYVKSFLTNTSSMRRMYKSYSGSKNVNDLSFSSYKDAKYCLRLATFGAALNDMSTGGPIHVYRRSHGQWLEKNLKGVLSDYISMHDQYDFGDMCPLFVLHDRCYKLGSIEVVDYLNQFEHAKYGHLVAKISVSGAGGGNDRFWLRLVQCKESCVELILKKAESPLHIHDYGRDTNAMLSNFRYVECSHGTSGRKFPLFVAKMTEELMKDIEHRSHYYESLL